MMKPTLLIASTFLPPICGGAERVAWEIAKRVANRFEIHIITTGEGSPAIKELVELHTVPRVRWMPITYSTIYRSQIEKVLNDVSPDIIHCHMTLPWGYILRNTPTSKVITCHEGGVPTRVDRYFINSAMHHANVITTPSNWSSQYIEENYGRKPLTIPNGVDTGTFRSIPEIQRHDNVVLYVGRFMRNKGALDLVEAARALPEYEFWFAGGADPRNVGRQRVEIPSMPNVKAIEFIPDRDALASLYNQATICAFPSQYENFPLVGLEAMACGRTLVATKGPRNGYSEYVQNGSDGLLIEPHDVNALVEAIKYLMENVSVREEFEQNASKKVKQYDWGIIAEKYAALLEALVHR
ncbi:MAG: glycosyltransferase family 4 protein [Candidatus Bathyarchaeia archaeon]|jgi:rhamnosyl/mannosyltransferase